MSLEGITNEVMETLKRLLIEKMIELVPTLLADEITELIPTVLQEATPNIIARSKDMIEQFVISNSDTLKHTLSASFARTKAECKEFDKKHGRYIDRLLSDREKVYYKFARCKHMVILYDECLNGEQPYVPKKFRSDNYHVKTAEELDIVNRFDLEHFRGEREILRIRRDEYENECIAIDTKMIQLLEKANLSDDAEKKCLADWQKLIEQDITRIEKKRESKNNSTKRSFEKDKLFIAGHQRNRIKKSNSPPSNNNISNDPQPLQLTNGASNQQQQSTVATTSEPSANVPISDIPTAEHSTSTSLPPDPIISSQSTTPIPTPDVPDTPNTSNITEPSNLYDPEHIELDVNVIPETDISSDSASSSKNLIGTASNHPPIPPTQPSTQDLLRALRPRPQYQK